WPWAGAWPSAPTPWRLPRDPATCPGSTSLERSWPARGLASAARRRESARHRRAAAEAARARQATDSPRTRSTGDRKTERGACPTSQFESSATGPHAGRLAREGSAEDAVVASRDVRVLVGESKPDAAAPFLLGDAQARVVDALRLAPCKRTDDVAAACRQQDAQHEKSAHLVRSLPLG